MLENQFDKALFGKTINESKLITVSITIKIDLKSAKTSALEDGQYFVFCES